MASKGLASQDAAPGILHYKILIVTNHACLLFIIFKVPFLTFLLFCSTLCIPSPKSCDLVRSLTKTGPMCFLEPECRDDCSTTLEQQCSTRQEQQCRTVSEQQCSTGSEFKCNTVNEQQCSTVNKQKCTTGNPIIPHKFDNSI